MRNAVVPMLAALLAAGCAAAPSKTIVIPANFDRAYDVYHYAPAVRVGDTVIVSGIPAGPGADYEAQIRAMFVRLKSTLEAAGATLDDVVEIETFHVGAKDATTFTAEFERFAPIHKEFFRADTRRGPRSARRRCSSKAHRSKCARSPWSAPARI
ncbi:Rid family hydrolase [Tahibacter soli]|uniref:Rid family hydrolase n=1 Tax=Tahibacter soli TaxID=2983605 RepID=A0A9X3YP50_9GAMM|nr:Rid family hydrolase [Tahibacter soli]MDC8014875.1 Rid family hydrolase [Tahibacter soli]